MVPLKSNRINGTSNRVLFLRMDLFSLILSIFCPSLIQSQNCELVPIVEGKPQFCLDLQASPLITTDSSEFGPLIEGASTNPEGHIFGVNYENNLYSLGQLSPTQKLFFSDPNDTSSFFNGIRFLNATRAFAGDVANHRVLQLEVDPSTDTVVSSKVFCQNQTMLQPNDLTLSKSGTVFTSGMRWLADTNDTDGDIWSCTPSGEVQLLEIMGRTNGIDLSPDDKLLYVSESYNSGGRPVSQKIWVYDAFPETGRISGKRLFVDFSLLDNTAAYDIDGMKTDVNGNLFVARYGGRQVVVLSPQGDLIGRIALSFPNPTNLDFGGDNGKVLYVVGQCDGADKGCVDTIQVVNPGRAWTNLQN